MFNEKEYMKGYCKKRYEENKEVILEKMKGYYQENKDKIIERMTQYYKDNKEQKKEYLKYYRINNPDKRKRWDKKYRENNSDKINKYNTIYGEKYYKKIGYAISKSLKGSKAGRHWENLVDYTLEELIKHLKKNIPEGYTWQDYIKGKLHLDHILPLRLFQFKTSEDNEFKQCWSLYNLQLLTKGKNLSKRDSINNPILLGLLLKEMI